MEKGFQYSGKNCLRFVTHFTIPRRVLIGFDGLTCVQSTAPYCRHILHTSIGRYTVSQITSIRINKSKIKF